MTVSLEFVDGDVVEWRRGDAGVERRRVTDYEPALFVDGPDDTLDRLADWLAGDDRVTETGFAERFPSLHDREPSRMLRVAAADARAVRPVARRVRREFETATAAPGTLRLFDVDLDPGFRYCLDTGTDPAPTRDPRTLRVDLPTDALAGGDVSALRVDGDDAGDTEAEAVETLAARLAAVDPDALVVSSADVVPTVSARADAVDVPFRWGRETPADRGWRRLAGENTYHSYGRVGHSPARYAVPGRAVLDRSNSFLWGKAGLDGLLYLVARSGRPLQEAGRASIGGILTSMQIRHARARDVPAPWRPWEAEQFKPLSTLHDADRGGATLAPTVGYHEDVVELDFASLYPELIRQHNLSAETVRCGCCDGDDVPGLGYSVCDREGFLPGVLARLLDDRARCKRRAADGDDAAGRVADAIKWVLVSCFGYQGYRNAKFGVIECHEAINAFAREALLDAKDAFERGGWSVLHAIVDSVWIRADGDDPADPASLAAAATDAASVPLEHEADYDWVCFVPKRGSQTGALTRYFGRRSDGGFRVRGIECRQRSTPAFVADAQRDLLRAFDADRTPEAVCDRLAGQLRRLRRGDVDPSRLVVDARASKSVDEYDRETLTAAALERYADAGVDRAAGQSVAYVVTDDDARGRGRVRLPFEDPDRYDADYYRRRLLRAAESVVSPVGWDRDRIERFLAGSRDATLSAF
ncbi:type B DNA-directed DNA polymerase [Halobaculum sp. D14]|uniref:type B DNA-directed DNA polymerase n=1 Tax=Halobaculum sp. D14 TaxID=3421642 RepID=UPI003EBA5CA5